MSWIQDYWSREGLSQYAVLLLKDRMYHLKAHSPYGGYQRVSSEFEVLNHFAMNILLPALTIFDSFDSTDCPHIFQCFADIFPFVYVFLLASWISFVLKAVSFGLRRRFLFGTMCNWIAPWKLKFRYFLFICSWICGWPADQHCACEASLGADIEEALRSSQALTTSAQTLQDGRNGVEKWSDSRISKSLLEGDLTTTVAQYPFLAEHVCLPWKPSDLRWMAIHGWWFSLDWTMMSCPQLSIACALLRNAFWKGLFVTAHTNTHTDTNATAHLHFALLR